MLGLALAPAEAVVLLLFQSAGAKVFWQVAVAVAEEPCAVQVRPRPAVGAEDSVKPAVVEPERYRVSAPEVPLLAGVPTWVAARED